MFESFFLRGILAGSMLTITCSAAADDPLAIPPQNEILQTLRSDHPRLLATADDFQKLDRLCDRDARVARWRRALRDEADQLLETPTVHYEIPDGKRLLSVSRRAKSRMLLLGMVYRLTGELRYAERLWRELETVIGFKDWNPSHFLDTAEMTFAVAIGYDWGYDALTPQQRARCVEAIVRLGFRPGLDVYREQRWWSRSVHNWNQVCNGGLGVGALAVGDEQPDVAREILHSALQSLPRAMHEFRPDGGWAEGPGYWRYATEYNVYLLAALQTALGTDFGLSQMPGFPVTGDFPIHFVSPTGLTFNYADAHANWSGAPQLFWLATRFDTAAYAAAQLPYAQAAPSASDFLWGADWLNRRPTATGEPTARLFQGVSVVCLRSAWDDPDAVFVGFKGGDNRVNHGQLDLGSFVLDALGERWAVDLGPDDYNIPGYFGKQRWSYYRNMTAGHNTLLINRENQPESATAAIVAFGDKAACSGAIADLSNGYPSCERVQRGIALIDRQTVLVQDELESDAPVDVEWRMHTHADVQITGGSAVLLQNGNRLLVRIVTPSDAVFDVTDVSTAPPQKPLRNTRCLRVVLPQQRSLRIAVAFRTTPAPETPLPAADLGPLRDWPLR